MQAIENLVLDNPSVILTFLGLMLFALYVKIQVIQFLDLKEALLTILVPEHKHEKGDFSSSIQHNLSMSASPRNISSGSGPGSKPSNVPMKSPGHSVVKNPPSVPVNLGVFIVEEVQLWVMGSHGPNNEYISCGGIVLE